MKLSTYPDCLLDIGLKVLGEFTASHKHHNIECLLCGNVFLATPKSKMANFKQHGAKGCPKCTMDFRFAEEKRQMQEKIKSLGFIVSDFRSKLDEVEATNTNCKCGRSWKTKPIYLLSERSFCKPCNDELKSSRMKSFNETRTNQSLQKIGEFRWYKKVVMNMSNTNYINNQDKFNLKRNKQNHLDHIVPVSYCFKNKIPPEVCAGLDNLRVIPAIQNLKKNINITTKIPDSIKQYIPENLNILDFKNTLKTLVPSITLDQDIGDYNYVAYDENCKLVFHILENSKVTQQAATRSSMYQSKKNLLNHGIKSFFFFEDEWINKKDIILNKIKHSYKISSKLVHARKCEIKQVDPKEKNNFLQLNHILGSDKCNFAYGAYYQNELVAIMTFSKPKIFMKGKQTLKDKYELSRFCIKGGYSVTGIANRLLKQFKKEVQFDEIFSFADYRLSDGDMYHKLGFQLKNRVDLDYCYLIDGVRHHRWSFRKDMIKEKFPNIYDENKKEYQMMLELGHDRIWDCGKLKFVMYKHNSNT